MNPTDQRLYSEGFRLGWANARAGYRLSSALAAQMVTTPRGLGYVEGWTKAGECYR